MKARDYVLRELPRLRAYSRRYFCADVLSLAACGVHIAGSMTQALDDLEREGVIVLNSTGDYEMAPDVPSKPSQGMLF